jgi:DNA repair exonuclease SbcCD ATPase subunit
VLTDSLSTVSDKHKSTTDDKKDQAGQIERLRQQVKTLTQQRDAALADKEKARAEHAEVGKKFDDAHSKVGKLEGVEEHAGTLTLQLEKLRSELAIVTAERDSLTSMLAQKDAAMQAQAQQAERSIRTLQLKQTALERSLALTAATSEVAAASSAAERYAASIVYSKPRTYCVETISTV